MKSNSPFKFRKYLMVSILLCSFLPTFGQQNSDSLFMKAILNAGDQKYDQAIQTCKTILTDYDRNDVKIYLGSLYGWTGQYDQGVVLVKGVLDEVPSYDEAYDVLMNLYLWSEDYENLFALTDQAEKNGYNDTYNLLIKRIYALQGMEQHKQAIELIDNSPHKDSAQVDHLKKVLRFQKAHNKVTLYAGVDAFSQAKPYHFEYLEYGHFFKRWSLFGRVNRAYRFGNEGYQYEMDAYVKTFKKQYMYLNYGYSEDNLLFPNHRLGFEYYAFILKNLEASLGMRYLIFNDSNTEIDIYTAYLGYYHGSIWAAARGYFVPVDGDVNTTFKFFVRHYLNEFDDYVGVEFTQGVSPDERSNFILNRQDLTLFRGGVEFEVQKTFAPLWQFKVELGYGNEEYQKLKYRDRYFGALSLIKRF